MEEAPLLSTAYFPPIQYFSILKQHNTIFLESRETYPKQTFRNRCEIGTANGKLSLSIPVVKPFGKRTLISEVLIDHSTPWAIKHWRAIQSAYRKSAYFELLEHEFASFYTTQWASLWEFNHASIKKSMEILGMETTISPTLDFARDYPFPTKDFRNSISPKAKGINTSEYTPKPYFQVFGDRHGFIPSLSILDLIFNCGPEGIKYL